MTPLSFAALPTEIVQRVLINGPSSNSLTLSCVSKRFHTICTDPMLYYNIIGPEYHGDHSERKPTWFDSLHLNLERDWHVCAKWAYAEELATRIDRLHSSSIGDSLHSPTTDMKESMLSWLPELLVQGCKPAVDIVLREESVVFSPDFNPNTISIDQITRLAFCDAFRATHTSGKSLRFCGNRFVRGDRSQPHHLQSIDDSYAIAIAAYKRVCPTISVEVLQLAHYSQMISRTGSAHVPDLQHMLVATLMSATFNGVLNLANTEGFWFNDTGYLPGAIDVPFDELYAVKTPPFSVVENEDSRSPFLFRHLPHMTAPEFLAEGEWVGYYCYMSTLGSEIRGIQFDAMMHSIHFEISADYADHCAINSGGEDEHGLFTLLGTCHKNSGWFQMTKEYEHGITWMWSATMTPFGIIGTWGSDRDSEPGGFFRLWKSSWSDGVSTISGELDR